MTKEEFLDFLSCVWEPTQIYHKEGWIGSHEGMSRGALRIYEDHCEGFLSKPSLKGPLSSSNYRTYTFEQAYEIILDDGLTFLQLMRYTIRKEEREASNRS